MAQFLVLCMNTNGGTKANAIATGLGPPTSPWRTVEKRAGPWAAAEKRVDPRGNVQKRAWPMGSPGKCARPLRSGGVRFPTCFCV